MTKVDGLTQRLKNKAGIKATVMRTDTGYVLMFNNENSLIDAADKFGCYINLDLVHHQAHVARQDMLHLIA